MNGRSLLAHPQSEVSMQTPQPPDGGGLLPDLRRTANVFALVCEILAVSTAVFIRRRFGPRYLGIQAALAALAIPFFVVFFPYDDPRYLGWYFVAFLAMWFLARTGAAARAARGVQSHSRYNGFPHLCSLLPWVGEFAIKRIVEPAVVLAVGAAVAGINEPLGVYLMLSSFGLAATAAMHEMYERQRAMDMLDAYMDQQALAERFRQMRNERSFLLKDRS